MALVLSSRDRTRAAHSILGSPLGRGDTRAKGADKKRGWLAEHERRLLTLYLKNGVVKAQMIAI